MLRWEFQMFDASTDDDLKTAFESMARRKIGTVNVVPDTFFTRVGSGKHDPAADGDGLAAQGWIEQLLDRRIEGIKVRM
jgi:hypothetical protein